MFKKNVFKIENRDFSKSIIVENITRNLLPPIQNNIYTNEVMDGGIFLNATNTPLEIKINVAIINDKEQLKQLGESLYLYKNSPFKLTIDNIDNEDVFYYVVFDGQSEIEHVNNICRLELSFISLDGFCYKPNLKMYLPYNRSNRSTVKIPLLGSGLEQDFMLKVFLSEDDKPEKIRFLHMPRGVDGITVFNPPTKFCINSSTSKVQIITRDERMGDIIGEEEVSTSYDSKFFKLKERNSISIRYALGVKYDIDLEITRRFIYNDFFSR